MEFPQFSRESTMNGIGVVFTSVLSSGVVAAAISASFNEAKERWLLRRSKIEEIYLSSAAWLKFVQSAYLHYLRVCKGSITYNQALDLQLKHAEKTGSNTTGDQNLKMKMNIEMYEPSLVPALRLIEQELKKLNSVVFAIEDCCRKNGQLSEFLRPLDNQLEAFGAAGDALIAAVVLRGAEIGAERGQVTQAYEWAAVKTRRCSARVGLHISKCWYCISLFTKSKR
jgi:hypothetical protein